MSVTSEITKDIATKAIIVVVIVLLGYFLIVRPILMKFGIIESKEDKQRDKTAKTLGTATNSPFSPSYYKTIPGAMLLTRSSADKLAKELNNAIGFWYDDENAVYGVLRQLKAKTQLSYLSDVFFQNYKMDLYQLLQRNFSDKEIDVVNSIAANLS